MQNIRPAALSSFTRKLLIVLIVCGMMTCFLVINMRQVSIEFVNEANERPRAQVQAPDVIKHPIPAPSFDDPLPPGNVRPIQDLLMHQAKSKDIIPQQNEVPPLQKEVPKPINPWSTAEFSSTTEGAVKASPPKGDKDEAMKIVSLLRQVEEKKKEEDTQTQEQPTMEGSEETETPDQNATGDGLMSLAKQFDCSKKDSQQLWCTIDPPEDLMQIKLPPFMKNYKNPCWRVVASEEGPPPIRCLPYFFLIGAPKSGTTDLFERMIKHPQISGLVKKEIHWFSRRRYAPRGTKNIPQHPMFENYTDLFKEADTDLFLSTNADGFHDKIFGDSSVSTLWDNYNAVRYSMMTGQKVPKTAECIQHLNPNTKFVSIIRDPVERTYSDYLYFDSFPNKTKEAFHEAVVAAIDFQNQCLETHSLQECINYRDQEVSRARLYVGIYYHHFMEYFKFFPKENFIILKLEDYSKRMSDSLSKVFSFLGLDTLSRDQMVEISDQSTVYNTRPSTGVKLGDMWPETRALLDDFYKPFNEELGLLLGQHFNYNKKT